MEKIIKKLVKRDILIIFFSLLGILLLGNKLREYSYSSVPNPGEVADEYCYGWLGISLIKERYPISWSILNLYDSRKLEKINVDGIYNNHPEKPPFPIVKPWFDNPPLFGLITGGYAYLKGAKEFSEASVILLRRPMLKIAILTSLAIFILGLRLYGPEVGLLAALIYSAIPTTVISSRLALVENGYIPLFLGALIFADIYLEKRNKIYWIIACFLSSIAVLFKLSGISIPLSLFFIALIYGKKEGKEKIFLLTSTIIAVLLPLAVFIVFGAVYGWKTFIEVFLANSSRFYGAGAEVVLQLVNQARLTTTKFLTDGWITLGWVSFFIVSFSGWKKEKGATIITLAVLSYLTVFILFGSESYGWYKFPFFPFLILSSARLLKMLYQKPNLVIFTILMLLPFGSSVHRLLGIVEFQKCAVYLRLFSVLVLLLFSLSLLSQNKKVVSLLRIFMIVVIGFVIWLSIKEIFFYTVDKWYFVT